MDLFVKRHMYMTTNFPVFLLTINSWTLGDIDQNKLHYKAWCYAPLTSILQTVILFNSEITLWDIQ
jgi:hypothetical protein